MFNKVARAVATCGYIGFVRYAPGTCASFISLFFWYALSSYSIIIRCLIITLLFIIGVWSSEQESTQSETSDPSWIVIDEWVGMGIALLACPVTIFWYSIAFLLFRFFDILKVFPINLLEQIDGGFGIMLDDCAAGGIAALIIIAFTV